MLKPYSQRVLNTFVTRTRKTGRKWRHLTTDSPARCSQHGLTTIVITPKDDNYFAVTKIVIHHTKENSWTSVCFVATTYEEFLLKLVKFKIFTEQIYATTHTSRIKAVIKANKQNNT